jgi:phage-related tail fiber protein
VAQLKPEVMLNSSGLTFGQAVQAIATGNVSTSGLQTLDSYTLQTGDRVLCVAQTGGIGNVVYIAAAGAWSIASDTATALSFTKPFAYWVQNGLTWGGSIWQITNSGTYGSTAVTWQNIFKNGQYSAFTQDANGNLIILHAVCDQGKVVVTPTTGQSITIPNYTSTYIINPASLLATLTVTMPPNPVDGQIVGFSTGNFGITALTLLPNTSQSLATGLNPGSMAASAEIVTIWHAASLTWFRKA